MRLLMRYCEWTERHPVAGGVTLIAAGLAVGLALCFSVVDPVLSFIGL